MKIFSYCNSGNYLPSKPNLIQPLCKEQPDIGSNLIFYIFNENIWHFIFWQKINNVVNHPSADIQAVLSAIFPPIISLHISGDLT